MIEILASAPLLTLFVAVALGTLVGAIPFGPVRFGPAGALFVGLAIGALDPRLGEGLGLVQSIGLALFVYTIGLAAGASFFRDLRKQAPLVLGATVILALDAGLVVLASGAFGLGPELGGGLFAGSLTATPALAAATAATGGSADPAVSYAITYPVAIIVTILAVTLVMRKRLPGTRDPEPPGGDGLRAVTVEIERQLRVSEIPGIASIPGHAGGDVRVSYLQREGHMSVARPDELLCVGDRVLLVGVPDGVRRAADHLGREVDEALVDDRSSVDFERFVVSDPAIAGRTVAELRIPARFDGIITRVRRGDDDLLAHAEMRLQLGDRVLVVAPKERLASLAALFGNSERRVTEVDFFSMGLGIALGVAVGLITIPLGGASLALGSAAGPLLVGLVLGYLDRTGPVVWTIPNAANLTIRQLGLVVFLAAVGLASGQAFASLAFSAEGVTIGLIAAGLLVIALGLFWGLGRLVGLSTARVAGAMAGFIGQPAILGHVTASIDDERTQAGYSALFALGIIVKILLVQFVVAF